MTVKEFRKLQIATWVRVRFDDVGARDGIIIDKNFDTKEIKVFEPLEHCTHWMEKDRIMAVGPQIRTTPEF
jgi:hypothetical protein